MNSVCRYPIVFVHGMYGWGKDEGINHRLPYWGANSCNIVKNYNEIGYETYAASVGPVSSAWDRACELYACLTGGIVDYGKVHSKRYNHKRYGRCYSVPLISSWDRNNKIHLIGHSFGGNTIRMLAHLLTYGAPEEVEQTNDSENLSKLFKGGQSDLLASVVTICSPHNGSTAFLAAQKFGILPIIRSLTYNYVGLIGRTRAEGTIFDFHLEQFGLSNTPGQKDADSFIKAKKRFKLSRDSIDYDMSPDGAHIINKRLEITSNIYYFSYSYSCVKRKNNGKHYLPYDCNFPFLTFTSSLLLAYNRFFKKDKRIEYEEIINDGLVELSSTLHPDDEPFQKYDDKNLVPGIWNVMKTRKGDHGTPIGLLSKRDETFHLYDEIFSILFDVEKCISANCDN